MSCGRRAVVRGGSARWGVGAVSPLLPLLLLSVVELGCGPGDGAPAPEAGEPGRPEDRAVADHRRPPALLPEAGSAAGRHLVLITLDTTRADRLGSYGHAVAATPHLDRLANAGVRFADAVTPVPMTLPAHASLFTGLDPPAHGVRANGEYTLGPEAVTLAELLEGAGYATAAFVSSFVLAPRFGLEQGFTVYDAELPTTRAAAFGAQNERSAEATTDAAITWLEGREEAGRGGSAGPPLFLWVHYFDPHDPYAPPEPWASRFAGRPYDGEIAYVDSQVGRLLAALEAGGLAEDSVIVATADHGESLGEHGERYHSRTLYEGAVRVPLIVVAPGLIEGPAVADGEVVGLVDLFPTLLDLLGVDRPADPELDGRSLLGIPPARSGPEEGGEPRALYLETLNTYLDNGWAPLYALRRHRDKRIEAPRPEYYDLVADPEERRNLLAGEPEAPPAAEELGERLGEILAGRPGIVEAASRREIDPEVRRRLEALGYLSSGAGPVPRAGELPDPKDMLPLHEELLRAREALATGRAEEAARTARALVRAAPRNRAALQLLGEANAQLGRLDRAEAALRRHLEVGPSVGASVLLAQVVMQQGRLGEAAALLDGAAELDPLHGAVPLARGDLWLVQGRVEEAVEMYEEARRVDPVRFAGLAEARIERVRGLMERR